MPKPLSLLVAFAAGVISFPWLYACSDWLLAVRRERQWTTARYQMGDTGGRVTQANGDGARRLVA